MIASEIMLPPHAPEIYLDRATLWNAVENCEKHPKAQLAYSFDIAMQNELTLEENMELARKFVPFPVSWTVKMKKKQKETQDILSYHTQAAGCSDKARAKASGGRQPIEECGRTGL